MDENGMPIRNDTHGSDAATFSNLNPNTSDANALGGGGTAIVWGTDIVINDSIAAITDFLKNFQKKYRMLKDGEIDDVNNLPADHPGHTREYVVMMNTMLDLGVSQLNLDTRNLKAYPNTIKLWHQLQSFPAEIIPAIDEAIKDVMQELADKRMQQMRTAHMQQAAQRDSRNRESSAPAMPSSDIDGTPTPQQTLQPLNDMPDLAEEVMSRMYKSRTFGLDNTINLRDLNPGDMDRLISIKGLVIRTTPIIPDMREGESEWLIHKSRKANDNSIFQVLDLSTYS